jgi:membrane protease YdiL (CAAX protease family)
VSRLGWLLLAAGTAGFLLASPFLLHVIRAAAPPIAPGILFALHFLQSVILTAVAAWAGVRFAPRVGLDAPRLRALAERREGPPELGSMAIEALAVGSVVALAVTFVLLPLRASVPASLSTPLLAGFWTRASSAFYGGTVEEIVVRWGLLSALFALARRLGIDGFWLANVAAALVFGALHLPGLRLSHVALSGPVLVWVLGGNGLFGVVFGWIFRRRGLEGAMIAHGAADLWLQALLPLLLA